MLCVCVCVCTSARVCKDTEKLVFEKHFLSFIYIAQNAANSNQNRLIYPISFVHNIITIHGGYSRHFLLMSTFVHDKT